MSLSEKERFEIEQLVHRECAALDEGRYADWLELFDPEGSYWIPMADGECDPETTPSLIFERVDALPARVGRLMHPAAHGLDASIRTARVLGSLSTKNVGPYIEASARFHLLEEQRPSRQRWFGGCYRYLLVYLESRWRIHQKRVDLLNPFAPFEAIQIIL